MNFAIGITGYRNRPPIEQELKSFYEKIKLSKTTVLSIQKNI
jgi:hypothetical protein